MNLKKANQKVINATNRIAGINKWIKDNPDVTAPNMYEITDCMIEVGEAFNKKLKCYGKDVVRNYNISTIDDENKNCTKQFLEMLKLREAGIDDFLKSNKSASKLFNELYDTTLEGHYIIPKENPYIKKELLDKLMGVMFYIYQVKQTNPNYEYDNRKEFEEMKEMFDIYKSEETDKYGQLQYKDSIEKCLESIEKDYKYKETKGSRKIK